MNILSPYQDDMWMYEIVTGFYGYRVIESRVEHYLYSIYMICTDLCHIYEFVLVYVPFILGADRQRPRMNGQRTVFRQQRKHS